MSTLNDVWFFVEPDKVKELRLIAAQQSIIVDAVDETSAFDLASITLLAFHFARRPELSMLRIRDISEAAVTNLFLSDEFREYTEVVVTMDNYTIEIYSWARRLCDAYKVMGDLADQRSKKRPRYDNIYAVANAARTDIERMSGLHQVNKHLRVIWRKSK